jgi:hypothetical protein
MTITVFQAPLFAFGIIDADFFENVMNSSNTVWPKTENWNKLLLSLFTHANYGINAILIFKPITIDRIGNLLELSIQLHAVVSQQIHTFSYSFLLKQRMSGHSPNIQSILHIWLETSFNEFLALVGNHAFGNVWECHRIDLQHYALLEDIHLAHLVTEGFLPIQHLIVDDANGPYIHLRRDHRFLVGHKALGWKVPVGTHALRSEFDDLLAGGLAESKIGDFNPAFVEHDILRFQVVVDYFLWQLMQVLDGTNDLFDEQFGLFLRQSVVFLDVERQVGSLAVLQDCTEGLLVQFYGSVEFHDVGMVEEFVHNFLPRSMLYKTLFDDRGPFRGELMKFDSHFP